jgi:hypothetical protein
LLCGNQFLVIPIFVPAAKHGFSLLDSYVGLRKTSSPNTVYPNKALETHAMQMHICYFYHSEGPIRLNVMGYPSGMVVGRVSYPCVRVWVEFCTHRLYMYVMVLLYHTHTLPIAILKICFHRTFHLLLVPHAHMPAHICDVQPSKYKFLKTTNFMTPLEYPQKLEMQRFWNSIYFLL